MKTTILVKIKEIYVPDDQPIVVPEEPDFTGDQANGGGNAYEPDFTGGDGGPVVDSAADEPDFT